MFITSSYSRVCFLIWKFLISTRFCAVSIERFKIGADIASPSGGRNFCSMFAMRGEENILIRGSSKETKNLDCPGSPCLADLPRSCRSIRLELCLDVPITYRPPSSATPLSSLISVPRPAILVATVIASFLPAKEMISASLAWFFAFKTVCFSPSPFRMREIFSEISTDSVPIRIGCPVLCANRISVISAVYFSLSDIKTSSLRSFRIHFLCVGTASTSRL
ncbi:MAG: hypothetical protein SP1CHLAM9_11100 [Chlamydiia bacterium]|nr:hypothetical protein [Chlamydiia bacterium]